MKACSKIRSFGTIKKTRPFIQDAFHQIKYFKIYTAKLSPHPQVRVAFGLIN